MKMVRASDPNTLTPEQDSSDSDSGEKPEHALGTLHDREVRNISGLHWLVVVNEAHKPE